MNQEQEGQTRAGKNGIPSFKSTEKERKILKKNVVTRNQNGKERKNGPEVLYGNRNTQQNIYY